MDLSRWRRTSGQRMYAHDLRHGSRRTRRREVRRQNGEHHGQEYDDPRKGEHADEVMRALFETRTIRQPTRETHDETEDRANDTDDGAVRTHDESHVTIRRANRLEHSDRPHSTLREYRRSEEHTSE